MHPCEWEQVRRSALAGGWAWHHFLPGMVRPDPGQWSPHFPPAIGLLSPEHRILRLEKQRLMHYVKQNKCWGGKILLMLNYMHYTAGYNFIVQTIRKCNTDLWMSVWCFVLSFSQQLKGYKFTPLTYRAVYLYRLLTSTNIISRSTTFITWELGRVIREWVKYMNAMLCRFNKICHSKTL